LRINDRIRVREVRLINAAGEQVGVVATFKAIEAALESGLDLVEVSPEAHPPVCKIMDYGKYKYISEKKEKEARKKAHVVITKEIKIRPKIDKHDLDVKLRHIKEFLDDGNKVRLAIVFRGREMAHQEFGRDLMERCLKDLEEKALVEQYPKMEGNYFGALLGPKNPNAKPKPVVEKPAPASEAAVPAAPVAAKAAKK
jgi:translation initiation factor IF-3